MGEHGGERDHRARGAAMRELAIHLVGDRALLQHHHHVVRPLRQRRDVQVDRAVAGIARRAEIDLVFVDRRAARAHLLDEGEQGTAERHQIAQQIAPQQRQRHLEKGLRRHVGVGHHAIGRHHDDRMRQCVEYRIGGGRCQHWLGGPHAGVLAMQSKYVLNGPQPAKRHR